MEQAAKRRERTGGLLVQPKPQAETAAAVGAPRQTVHRWRDVLNADSTLSARARTTLAQRQQSIVVACWVEADLFERHKVKQSSIGGRRAQLRHRRL